MSASSKYPVWSFDTSHSLKKSVVQTALWWDAWARPSPDLGSELREKSRGTKNDPNFVDNLPRFMAAGRSEDRTTPDLPSDLRYILT